MKKSPVRYDDKVFPEFVLRRIFGMNVFRANKVLIEGSPELDFFENLSRTASVSVHTGSLHDLADTAEEVFGLPGQSVGFESVSVGVFGGAFYSTRDWSLFPPCFFPLADSSFWRAELLPTRSHLREIFSWDALAVYVNPLKDDPFEAFRSLFNAPYESNESWISTALSFYSILIVSSGDGSFLKAFAKSKSSFELLDDALKNSENLISSSSWFMSNKNELVWDKDCTCLMLNR